MRAIGYARLSKADERSVSIEYQIEAIQRLALQQGYTLVDIQIDYGISGAHMSNRPGVQNVLCAVKDHKVQAVIVYRSDRLSRDGIEGLVARQLFDRHGVSYLSATEGELKYDIMGFVQEGMSREERKKISERTREALQLKKSKGERLGSQCPYGQKIVQGQIVEVPEEQSLINRVRELRTQGLSSYKITDAINTEGFRTRKQTIFQRTQIVRIMKLAA